MFQRRVHNSSQSIPEEDNQLELGVPDKAKPRERKKIKFWDALALVGIAVFAIDFVAKLLEAADHYADFFERSFREQVEAVVFPLCAVAIFFALRALVRQLFRNAQSNRLAAKAPTPSIKRIASTSTKNRCSLTGLFLGSTTLFCLLANKATQGFETVNASSLNHAVSSLALWFTFLAVLSLFLAPFLRGRALVRIPIFYIAGFALTAFTYKYSSFRIDKWEPFLAMVQ